MANRGINGGLDGLISFHEETIPGGPAIAFNIKIDSYTGKLSTRPISRTGPGSNGIPKIRLANIRGGGSASGKFTWNGPPLPNGLNNASGTITYQLDSGYTVSFPAVMTNVEFSHIEEGKGADENFHSSFNWSLAGAVTVTWPGNRVTFSPASANDAPTYEGRGKKLDPQGLSSTATVRIDCEGVADDDITQSAKIVALIAAASAPMANLKPVSISCSQYEDDSNGLQAVVEFALQDSKDNVETPENINTVDANNLKSQRTLAAVWPVGTPPSTPSAPSGLKLIDYTDKKLNDQLMVRIFRWGETDSLDDIILPDSSITGDPANLEDAQTIAVVFTKGSPPADPALPNGLDGTPLELVSKKDVDKTPTLTERIYIYGRNNSAHELEHSVRYGTETDFDANLLEGNARVTKVALTASPPSTPAAPISGVKFTSLKTRPLNALYSFYSFMYEPMDSKDKLQLSRIIIDPDGLESSGEVPLVGGTPTVPSGQFLVETENRQLANGQTLAIAKTSIRGSNIVRMQNDGSELSLGVFPTDSYERSVRFVACSSGDDTHTIAQTYWAALLGTTSPTQGYPFRYLRARRYHSTMMMYTVYFQFPSLGKVDNGAKIEIVPNLQYVKFRSWFGSNGTAPTINLVEVKTRGTGAFQVQLGQYEVAGIFGNIRISQTFTGAAPPLSASSWGKTNATTFLPGILGMPPQSVMFIGATYTILDNPGGSANVYKIVYSFQVFYSAAWVGFPTISGIPPGGLINCATNVNGGTLGDFVGSGGPTTYTFTGLSNVKVLVPGTDAFSFTSGWSQ